MNYLKQNVEAEFSFGAVWDILRAIAGNTSRIKIFLILCIQFVLCMDCQFMK